MSLGSITRKLLLLGLGAGLLAGSTRAVAQQQPEEALNPPGITLLDESYENLPLPEADIEEQLDEVRKYDHCDDPKTGTISAISSDNPAEITELLQATHPEAYETLELYLSGSETLTLETALPPIARLTRRLEGTTFTQCSDRDPLTRIVSSMFSVRNSTPEGFEAVLQTSAELVEQEESPTVTDVTRFGGVAFNFSHSTKQPLDKTLVGTLSDFYLGFPDVQNGFSSVGPEELTWLYKILPSDGIQTRFKDALGELQGYVVQLDKIQQGLGGEGGVDTLLRTLPQSPSIEDIRSGVGSCMAYAKTLASRGEQQIDRGFQAFKWHGQRLSPEVSERLLQLHEHYGILQFSRLQKDATDFSLIDELLQGKDPAYKSDLPLAAVFMPRVGEEPIFDTFSMGKFYNTLQLLTQGYKLQVYSVASEEGFASSFKDLSEKEGRTADLVLLAGHGSGIALNWGSDLWEMYKEPAERLRGQGFIHYGNSRESQKLDITDTDLIQGVSPYVNSDAQVILYSCSTGNGATTSVNLANTVASALPGRTIFAPDNDTRGVVLVLHPEDKTVVSVSYLPSEDLAKGPAGTYTVLRPSE